MESISPIYARSELLAISIIVVVVSHISALVCVWFRRDCLELRD